MCTLSVGGSNGVVSLNSATSGDGSVLDNGAARSVHTAIVSSSGSITDGSVGLEGSLDNSTWMAISSQFNIGAQPNPFAINVSGQAWQYIRASISTTVAGGSITVTVASAH